MITYVYGDLFQSPARVLVNPVNTVGVMGQGMALDFKRFYPEMFEAYRQVCQEDSFDIGQLMLYKTPHKWILNFPTKKHWRAKSDLSYIEAGLKKFVAHFGEKGLTSVSFPMLGGGLGELDWEGEVRPLMESYLNPLPASIYIHLYDPEADDPFAPERRNVRAIRAWLEGQPRRIGFEKFWRDLSHIIDDKRSLHTLDEPKQSFKVLDDPRKRNRRRNLILRLEDSPQPIFLAESELFDLWQYVRRAGYVLPQNLPGKLPEIARYVLPLVASVNMIRPVWLAQVGGEKIIGLHYIPPVEAKEALLQIIPTKA